MTEFNPFRTVQDLFDAAAEQLGLDRSARELLRWPMREFRALIPVHMDDGFIRVFHAHRVQYNYAMGPTIGGLRWHPDASVDPSRAAAAFTSWQTAVLQLPLAGASGGIDCNPKELSGGEKERLARGFVRAFQGVIGADRDIIVPDLYTTPQVMGWMLDAFERGAGHREPGVVAGKPVAVGGMPGHGEATARGAVILVREAASELDLDPKNLTFAIHGFGNLGRGIASQHLRILGGGRLVAVSDSRGGIRKESGLEPGSLNMHKIQTGRVSGMPDSEEITPDEVLALDVDVIYASAPPGRITVEHASQSQARIVC